MIFPARPLSAAAMLLLSSLAGVVWAAESAAPALPLGDAVIEFLAGSKASATITAVEGGKVFCEVNVAGRRFKRQYTLDQIRAVTVGGRRFAVNESAGSVPAGGSPAPSAPRATSSAATATAAEARSASQIERLVDQVGRTPPEWYDATPLEYPDSLDLSWPEQPPGQWNNQKNVGQYIWDIINPNPGKWRSGIRFMHFMLEKGASNPSIRLRAMTTLGRMYFDFFQDYARAAFWWRMAGLERTANPQAVRLAECYWRLGNRQMAVDLLKGLRFYQSIKLWADMGETRQAVSMAVGLASAQSEYADMAYMAAGDACRTAEMLDEALKYYGEVLNVPAEGKMAERIKRNQNRARANIEAIKLYDSLDLSRVPDGTYRGQSPAYAGDLFLEVTVASGRIQSVTVTRHQEKQFYSAINDTTGQIVRNQALKGIDATTGATITSEAIINATAKALAEAAR